MKPSLIIYWVRRDLRLADNPALLAAGEASRKTGAPFLPLFVLEDYMLSGGVEYHFGYPQRYFLSRALPEFASQFERFLLVQGRAANYLKKLAETYELSVFVNDDVYQDFYTQVDKLTKAGVIITVLEDALSVPKETRTGEGNLYSVFTPFKKNVWAKFVATVPGLTFSGAGLSYLNVADFNKLPNQVPAIKDQIFKLFSTERKIKVGTQIVNIADEHTEPDLSGWYFTEAEVLKRFKNYLTSGGLDAYADKRDSLELDVVGDGATSKMSLALAWGLISSRLLLSLIKKYFDEEFDNPFSSRVSQGALIYISELIWREFYRYQFFHHPELMNTEFQTRFRGTIAWLPEQAAQERFVAWVRGETGYPIVDAAMKQLAATGWMHNRSRMVVASILTKNLGVDWRWGQEYFRAMLIDLDEASNNGGWQWGASVGADPKPIRIFNPELQAKNYDASGAYQKRWLKNGDAFSLLAPSTPIVEHKVARNEALKRYGLEKEEPRDY
jgi:deoxyribodipyrimidine photo-lyase